MVVFLFLWVYLLCIVLINSYIHTSMANKDDEIIDLVNQNDEAIGEVLKIKANQDPSLIHREVAVILFDCHNEVLFQQRSFQKAVWPGVWDISCAGHVPKGMLPLQAAHMELIEELGFDTKLVFIEKTLARIAKETHFIYWFIGKYDGQRITLEKEEVEQVKFVSSDDLKQALNKGDEGREGEAFVKRFWKGEFDNLLKQLS